MDPFDTAFRGPVPPPGTGPRPWPARPSTPPGFSALCINDDSTGRFADAMIGSVGTPAAVEPGPRELVATDLGTGTLNAGDLSLAAGWAGADVVGVTCRSSAHGAVAATVNRGRFALWFPGDELRDTAKGIDVGLTYRDGGTGTSRLSL